MISSIPRAELTLKETAILSGAPEKAIRHELAARVAKAGRVGGRRRFSANEVLYFFLVNSLPVGLDKEVRRDLFALLSGRADRVGRWRREAHRLVLDGPVPVMLPTDEVVARVAERVAAFIKGKARIVSRPEVLGGEPIFDGTRVSVRFVGERARKGESIAALLEDYPTLAREDVEFARLFVALGRPPGRPKKRPRFVRGDG